MASSRRMGVESSKTRALLLDAAELLMLEEGYSAVSARRIAERAALKPQLVHYYFRTMDDLLLELFRRVSDRRFEHDAKALDSSKPLWTLWELSSDASGTALNMEFIAVAIHREAIRKEIVRTAERFRSMQAEILSRAIRQHRLTAKDFPANGMAMLMAAISRNVVLEETLGISTGHAELLSVVERFIQKLEGPRPVKKKRA